MNELTESIGNPYPWRTRLRAFKRNGKIDWQIEFLFAGPNHRYNSGSATVASGDFGEFKNSMLSAEAKISTLKSHVINGCYQEQVSQLSGGLTVSIIAEDGECSLLLSARSNTGYMFNRAIKAEDIRDAIQVSEHLHLRGKELSRSLAGITSTSTNGASPEASQAKNWPDKAWQVLVWGSVFNSGDWPLEKHRPLGALGGGAFYTKKERAQYTASKLIDGGWPAGSVAVVEVDPPWVSAEAEKEVKVASNDFSSTEPHLANCISLWQVTVRGIEVRGGDWTFDDRFWTTLEKAKESAIGLAKEGATSIKVVGTKRSER
jgi:hypothetical protein